MEVTPAKPGSILYVITKATWGGAQHYVHDLITEAVHRGYSVGLAYGVPGILSERAAQLGVTLLPINGLNRDISLLDEFRALFSLYKIVRQMRPDILHLNSSKASFIGAVAGRLGGAKKVVFTAHGWAFTESRNLLSKILFLALHYFTADLSHVVIANSKATVSYTRFWPFISRKVHVVYPGLDSVSFKSRAAARAALIEKDPALAQVKDALWVGTIAELHKNKGIDIGIRAWRRANLGDAQWVVLGDGQEESHLEELAQTSTGVHLLGFVPDASAYLKAFDVFLLPSRTESFGYVLLEAGFAELPVIGTNVGGIPEVIGNGAGVLVAKNAPSEIAEALTKLSRDDAQRLELGTMLKERVSSNFPLLKMLRDTFALYS